MAAGFLEIGFAFGIEQRRGGIGKCAGRIVGCGMALGFDEDGPARPQAAESIVETAGDGDQFGGHGAVEVGAPEARGTLEAAVLVEDDAFAHQRYPGEEIGKPAMAAAVFGEVHHGAASLRR